MDKDTLNVVSVWNKTSDTDKQWLGTAFAIAQGYLMTARHVVINSNTGDKHASLFLRGNIFVDGPKDEIAVTGIYLPNSEGKTLAGLYQDDFAILTINADLDTNRFLPQHILKVNQGFNIAENQQTIYHVSIKNNNNETARNDFVYQGEDSGTGCWNFSQGVSPGESGSPVFTEGGLVGIAKAREPDSSRLHVIPYRRFADFIKQHVPKTLSIQAVPGFKDKPILNYFKDDLKGLEVELANKIGVAAEEVNNLEAVLLQLEQWAKQDPCNTLVKLYKSFEEWGTENLIHPSKAKKAKLLALWIVVKGAEDLIERDHLIGADAQQRQIASSIVDADVLLAYRDNILPGIAYVTTSLWEKRLNSNGAINYSPPESGREKELCVKDMLMDISSLVYRDVFNHRDLITEELSSDKKEALKASMEASDFISRLNARIKTDRKKDKNYFLVVETKEANNFRQDVLDTLASDLKALPIAHINTDRQLLVDPDLETILTDIFDLISHKDGSK